MSNMTGWERFSQKRFTVRHIESPVDFIKAYNEALVPPQGPVVVHSDAITRRWLDQYDNLVWVPEDGGRDAVMTAQAGFTGISLALLETGTLLLAEDSGYARLVSNMVPLHIALIPKNRLVNDWSEALAHLRARDGRVPRILSWISGPSQTADIDGTLIYGMHGPLAVEAWIMPPEENSSLLILS